MEFQNQTLFFVIELSCIRVCRFLSTDGAASLRNEELISRKFVLCRWFCEWPYCILSISFVELKNESRHCGVFLFMILPSNVSLKMTLSIRALFIFNASVFIMYSLETRRVRTRFLLSTSFIADKIEGVKCEYQPCSIMMFSFSSDVLLELSNAVLISLFISSMTCYQKTILLITFSNRALLLIVP